MDALYVYILQSEKTSKYYTGVSATPEKRLYFHNKGMNTSTLHGRPWRRIWLSDEMLKPEALRLERKIKKRGAARFLQDTKSGGHA